MQTDYFGFIVSAYGLSAFALLGLAAWVFVDARARHAEIKALEESGLRRRSARGPAA